MCDSNSWDLKSLRKRRASFREPSWRKKTSEKERWEESSPWYRSAAKGLEFKTKQKRTAVIKAFI
jgi:hypothetical protein